MSKSDRDIFAARTADIGAAGDGSGAPIGSLDDEVGLARARIDAEEAAWFVAVAGTHKVGMVFGELVNGEVDVRIWIHPDHRKKGYGTAALRKSRSEMAVCFPAVPMVVVRLAPCPVSDRRGNAGQNSVMTFDASRSSVASEARSCVNSTTC